MVGFGLGRYFSGKGHNVVPAYNANVVHGGVRLDIADEGQVERVMGEVRPDWVLHCAAMTDVDGCERDPEAAMKVNADATGMIAGAAKRHGAKMVYVSTSFVFGGSKEALWKMPLQSPSIAMAGASLKGRGKWLGLAWKILWRG